MQVLKSVDEQLKDAYTTIVHTKLEYNCLTWLLKMLKEC